MAVIHHDTRELSFKLVYCGTPLGGKTTNLTHVHQRIGADRRGDLVTLSTTGDRTLFFDFLPVHSMEIHGYRTKFMLYTVPGQVQFNASREMVLRGVDGIVFVADSQLDRMDANLASMEELRENLGQNGISLDSLPAVLQYNKRDLPDIAPFDYLEYLLNRGPRRLPAFEASATGGQNVFPTLNALAQRVLRLFHQEAPPVPTAAASVR